MVLLILLHLYKKIHIVSTRTGALSSPGDVYETINSARGHRFKAMIDRMCLCCPSNPNNEQNVWHHLSAMIFSNFFLMNCIFPICCLRSKLYLKVLLLQQLWCNNYYKYNWLIEKMEIMVWRNWVLLKIHRFKHFKQCCFCFNCSNIFFIYISMCISVFKWFTLNANALKLRF